VFTSERLTGALDAGVATGHHPDGDHEGQAQNEAGHQARVVHVADRRLGDHCVDDHQHRWRNQHTEHGRTGHHAHGQPLGVAPAQHLRHGHAGEHHHRSNGHAGDGGKDRVAHHGGLANAPTHAAEHALGHDVTVTAHAGGHDHEAHQHEQRGRAKFVFRDRIGGGLTQHLPSQCPVVPYQSNAHKRHQQQRGGNVHAQIDEQGERSKSGQPHFQRTHETTLLAGSTSMKRRRCHPARANPTAITRYCKAITAQPKKITAKIGHLGKENMAGVP